jgi:site-specific DNA recombinase
MTTYSADTVAFIYCRISQDREGAGLGVDRQLGDDEKLAADLGVPVARVFVDNDISASAFSTKRRPDYEEMLTAIGETRVPVIVITWHTDRLLRRPQELERYINTTHPRDVATHTVKSGIFDLTNANGRLQARMGVLISAWQVEKASEALQSKHQQSARLGTWRGGVRPFGYRADMTLEPTEADLIRQAYADIIAARALGAIVKEWNEGGVTSTTGKPWNYTTIRQVLLRQRNYGASTYKGEVRGQGQWPPITDEATWRTAKGILKDPARRRSASNVGIHLLAGLALCGICADGTTMISGTSHVRGDKFQIYRCRSGKHLARRADYCDIRVEEVVFARFGNSDVRELLEPAAPTENHAADSAEAMALRARRDEIKELWEAGLFTKDEAKAKAIEIGKRLSLLEMRWEDPERANALRPILTAIGDIEDREERMRIARLVWAGLDWSQRRKVVAKLMTVTIMPVPAGARRRFDPEFVEIGPPSATLAQ